MKRLIALALLCALSGCAQNTLPSAFREGANKFLI